MTSVWHANKVDKVVVQALVSDFTLSSLIATCVQVVKIEASHTLQAMDLARKIVLLAQVNFSVCVLHRDWWCSMT